MNGLAATTDYKSACRLGRTLPDRRHLATLKVRAEVKEVPRIATRLIKLMYGSKCVQHNHTLNR